MKIRYLLVLAAGAWLTGMLPAQAAVDMAKGDALAKASGCFACHTVDKKLVGPAFKEVAKKYKGNKTAKDKLIKKVKTGGSGVWGAVPMPPNSPKVKDADIKTLVEWVLAH